GDALQALAGVTVVGFDKTGTLTEGKPRVAAVHGPDWVLPMAAAVERGSEHPLAAAVLAAATGVPEATGFKARPGYGAEAMVQGARIEVGAARMFPAIPPDLEAKAAEAAAQGQSLLYVARDGAVEGLIVAADQPKPGAAEAVAGLTALGV